MSCFLGSVGGTGYVKAGIGCIISFSFIAWSTFTACTGKGGAHLHWKAEKPNSGSPQCSILKAHKLAPELWFELDWVIYNHIPCCAFHYNCIK